MHVGLPDIIVVLIVVTCWQAEVIDCVNSIRINHLNKTSFASE